MKKNFKRNAVVLTVLMFVCAAIYLNWSYSRGQETAETAKKASPSPSPSVTASGTSGLFYEGDTSKASAYFDDARLSRQQARDTAVSTLRDAAKTENASQNAIDETLEAITVMSGYSISEAAMETLIKAKGFEECVVFLSGDAVTVTVPAPETGLTTSEVSRITDIIFSETDLTAEQIRIIEVK